MFRHSPGELLMFRHSPGELLMFQTQSWGSINVQTQSWGIINVSDTVLGNCYPLANKVAKGYSNATVLL
jgi:hypothetical protein